MAAISGSEDEAQRRFQRATHIALSKQQEKLSPEELRQIAANAREKNTFGRSNLFNDHFDGKINLYAKRNVTHEENNKMALQKKLE